jgi:hypothetical protein
MLYREIIAVCSEIHTKHINTLCGFNAEFWKVKHGGTYSNWPLKGLTVGRLALWSRVKTTRRSPICLEIKVFPHFTHTACLYVCVACLPNK